MKKTWAKLVAWSRATQAKPPTFEQESKCLFLWDIEMWGGVCYAALSQEKSVSEVGAPEGSCFGMVTN